MRSLWILAVLPMLAGCGRFLVADAKNVTITPIHPEASPAPAVKTGATFAGEVPAGANLIDSPGPATLQIPEGSLAPVLWWGRSVAGVVRPGASMLAFSARILGGSAGSSRIRLCATAAYDSGQPASSCFVAAPLSGAEIQAGAELALDPSRSLTAVSVTADLDGLDPASFTIQDAVLWYRL